MRDTALHSRPALFQIRHQWAAEWKHHAFWVLLLVAFFVLKLFYRSQDWSVGQIGLSRQDWFLFASFAVPCAFVMRVLLSEPSGGTDNHLHTRPVDRKAIWTAKASFILAAVLLPQLITEAWAWRGFDLSFADLVPMVTSSLIYSGLPILTAAAVAITATSAAQLTVLILVTALTYAGMSSLVWWISEISGWSALTEGQRHLGKPSTFLALLPLMLTGALLLASWIALAIGRRRWMSWGLLAGSLVTAHLTYFWSGMGWLTASQPEYRATSLSLKTGPLPSGNNRDTQSLWPTLHVSGLPEDHVASVVSFSPAGLTFLQKARLKNLKVGPLFWGDWSHPYQNADQTLKVLSHYPETDLWLATGAETMHRELLEKVMGPEKPNQPWELKLAVHHLQQRLDLPLKALLRGNKEQLLVLKNGQRLAFKPAEERNSYYRLSLHRRVLHDRITPRPADLQEGETNQPGQGRLAVRVVLRDPLLGEGRLLHWHATSGDAINRGTEGVTDMEQSTELHLEKPVDQMQLTGLKLEDWLQRMRVEVWVSEFRGVKNFQLAPDQMEQLRTASR